MTRFIANYIIAFDNDSRRWRLFINHVGVLDDNGCVVSITPFVYELPNTRFLGRVAALVPNSVSDKDFHHIKFLSISPESVVECLNESLMPSGAVSSCRIVVLSH